IPYEKSHTTLVERIWLSRRLIPVAILIVVVIGSIYAGVATPTEAATIGVIGALALSWLFRALTWPTFLDGLLGATRTSCFCVLILAGASAMSIAMSYTGLPQTLALWLVSLDLSFYGLIFILTVLYLILGCFLDGFSMIVL